MLYIKTVAQIKREEKDRIRRLKAAERENDTDEFSYPILEKSEDFYRDINKKAFFCVSNVMSESVRFISIVPDMEVFDKYFLKYAKQLDLGLDYDSFEHEEITFSKFSRNLSNASRNNYILSDDDILCDFHADCMNGHWYRNCNYEELLISECDKDVLYERADKYLTQKGLKEEFDRIYSFPEKKHFTGNPCHYIIESSDDAATDASCRLLLSALYDAGRLKARRYSNFMLFDDANWSGNAYSYIFKSTDCGAVILNFRLSCEEEGEFASSYREIVSRACAQVQKNRSKALVIICIEKENDAIKSLIYEKLKGLSFVEIVDEIAFGDIARNYLVNLAKDENIKPAKSLLSKIEDGQGYTEDELKTIFDNWLDEKMKASYPQYKLTKTAREKISKEKPKGSAYDELMSMTGLTEAKEMISKALSFYKAQKIFKDRGLATERMALSMAFLGNPGTGKSETAQLVGRILKENDILTNGKVITCNQSKLVGKYVGHTAQQVKECFDSAVGNVLILEEIYSLCNDAGGFNMEAINEIVYQTDIHKYDVCVIYVGYEKELMELFTKNPGLKSRCPFYINFHDYTPDELCTISEFIAKKKGYALSGDAKDKLKSIFKQSVLDKLSGNARNARNMVEASIMNHAQRLVSGDVEKWTKEQLLTITAEDVPAPLPQKKETGKLIGFCA